MVEAADIDWETINAKLPYERSAEAKEKRRELFKQFDPNSNGYLSLAEVSIIYLISFETTPLMFIPNDTPKYRFNMYIFLGR